MLGLRNRRRRETHQCRTDRGLNEEDIMKRVVAFVGVMALSSGVCFGQAKNTPPPKAPPAPAARDIPRPAPYNQPPPKNTVVLPKPIEQPPRTIEQRIQNPQVRDFRDPLPPPKREGFTPLERVGPAPGPDKPVQPPPSNRSQQPPPSGVGPTYRQTF